MSTIVDPTTNLDALRAELADLPTATTAARRSGDVVEWMRLVTRAEDLPAEIAGAEIAALRHQLAEAWTRVDAAAAAESPLAEAAEKARQVLADHDAAAHATVGAGALQAAAARYPLQEAHQAAEGEADEAAYMTTLALADVDRLEQELQQLTGELPEDGDGIRALPRPVIATVSVRDEPYRRGHPSPKTNNLYAGERPLRFQARYLGEHCFTDDTPESRAHAEQEARRQQSIREGQDRFYDQHELRLRPGTQQWDIAKQSDAERRARITVEKAAMEAETA